MGSDSVKVEILKNILTILMLFFLQREYFLEDYLSGQKGAVQIVDFRHLK